MDKAQQWKRGNEYAPPHVEAAYRDGYEAAQAAIAQPVQPGYQRELDRFFRQVIYGDYMGDNPTDLSSALSAWAIVTTLVAQGKP